MDIDESIEQLSFGRTVPRIDTCLGLYLTPEVVFLAEVSVRQKPCKVLHLVRLPVPGAEAAAATKTRTVGSLNTEFLDDQDKLHGMLKKAMTDIKWGSKHLMVTFSHHFGLLRYFAMPAIDRRFWKMAVPAEAKKYVPIPFGSLSHDFQVRPLGPGPDKKPRMGALFGVTHSKNIANLRAVAAKLGLTLLGAELAPCSVERLWDTLSDASQPYAQVHYDGGHIRILISENGLPIFFREVFLPSDASVLDRRKVDLAGCIDFTRKQIGSPGPEKVNLSGRIGDLAAWRDAFAQDLGKPVEVQYTDKALGLRGGQWGGYAAIGAALRHLVSTPISIDLAGVSRVSDEDKRAAKSLLMVAGLAASIFLAMGGYKMFQVHMKERTLGTLTADPEVYQAFKGKSAVEVEDEIKLLRQRADSMGALSPPEIPLTKVMISLADSIPRSAWVTEVLYTNPVGKPGRKQPLGLTVKGKVVDRTPAVEQDVAYNFEKKLNADKVFMKAFPICESEVGRASQNEEAEAEMPMLPGKGSLAARVQNATQYTITCLSRKKGSI